MRRMIKIIDAVNNAIAHILCWLSLLLMVIVVYEVVARYLFNSPTLWSMEINQFILGVISLVAGGYCLLKDGHVRVDLFYPKFSPRTVAIVEMCTYPFVLMFCGVLIYYGGTEFYYALIENRVTNSVMEFLIWPMWLAVPLGGFFLGIQIIALYMRHIIALTNKTI